MGALDEIAKLKAARRLEIAAAEEERERAAEQSHRDSLARLDAAVRHALTGQCASWLAEFRVPRDLPPERMPLDGRSLDVWFEPPGHRRIGLCFERRTDNAGEWVLAHDDEGDWTGWYAYEGDSFGTYRHSLADALIAAEIEGWVPPAPVESEDGISPEAMHQARQAWEAMTQAVEPMPALMALGMVEEETGHDVDAAVSAIHLAAGEWLDRLRPEQPVVIEPGKVYTNSFNNSVAVRGYLFGEEYNLADNCRLEIHNTNREIQHAYDVDGEDCIYSVDMVNTANSWIAWCCYAVQAIDLCRATAAAAHPEPQPASST